MNLPIKLRHNLNGARFVWLWAKYVREVNDRYHCTNSIRGTYSKRLSKHNADLLREREILLDELSFEQFKAIYICGVSSTGYRKKANYPFNLHTAILPMLEASDAFAFDGWELSVENGLFMPIPSVEELPKKYQCLPAAYTTCRIFRWAVCSASQLPGMIISP